MSDADCSLTYSLTLSDDSAIDSSFLTFTPATRQLVISTSNIAKAGVYNLKLVGTITGFTPTNYHAITLTLVDACLGTVITQSVIPDPYVYDINSGTLDLIATLAFTQSVAYCGTITYTLRNQDTTAADSIVQLVSTNLIKVQTSLSAKVDDYYLEIVATVPGYTTSSAPFTLQVTDECAVATYYPPTINDDVYVIGETALVIPFAVFTSDNPNCEDFTYTA